MWRAKRLSQVLKHRDSLLKRLETAAPELASQIMSSFADHVWDIRMAKFTNAWNWARADQWLSRLNDPRAQERLSNALDLHRSRIRELIRDLAAAKAWRHCFSRLTEHERQNLMAWKVLFAELVRVPVNTRRCTEGLLVNTWTNAVQQFLAGLCPFIE